MRSQRVGHNWATFTFTFWASAVGEPKGLKISSFHSCTLHAQLRWPSCRSEGQMVLGTWMYLMDPKTIGAVTMPGPQACLQDRVCVPSEVKLRQQDHTHMVGEGLGGRTRPTPVIIRTVRKFWSAPVPSGADLQQGLPLTPLRHVSASLTTTPQWCSGSHVDPSHVLEAPVDFLILLTLSGHCVVSLSASQQGPWSALENCSCSVAKSCLTLWNPMDCSTPGFPVLHHLLEFTQTHVQWVGDAIQSSVVPFSSRFQSSPASGSFQMSQLFASGGQSTRASAALLPVNLQGWFPLGWTGWLSLQSKALLSLLPALEDAVLQSSTLFLWHKQWL